MLVSSRLLALFTCICTGISLAKSKCSGEHCTLTDNLFGWITENGGYVNSHKVEISTGPDEAWTVRGLFASQPLGKGEMIVSLPPALRICSPARTGKEDSGDSAAQVCQLISALAAEMDKGVDSFYWPYLEVLASDPVDVPLTWGADKLQWLRGIFTTADWHTGSVFMEKGCHFDPSDATLTRAGLLAFSRATAVQVDGEDLTCMCPVYDLMNHDNAGLNTAGAVAPGRVLSVGTSEEVEKGGQLFNSFGPNNVATLLRDYGFLPSYPRVWELAAPIPGGAVPAGARGGAAAATGHEHMLFVFEELENKRINLNPSEVDMHQLDRREMVGVLKAHLTEVERDTSVLNEALLLATSSTADTDTNTTSLKLLHRAKWLREQYTLAFRRALHAAEVTAADVAGNTKRRRGMITSRTLRNLAERKPRPKTHGDDL